MGSAMWNRNLNVLGGAGYERLRKHEGRRQRLPITLV